MLILMLQLHKLFFRRKKISKEECMQADSTSYNYNIC